MEMTFIIDDQACISIPIEMPWTELLLGMNAPAYLFHKDCKRYTIYNGWDDVWSALMAMNDSLKGALAHELEPPTKWPSLGYALNQYLQRRSLGDAEKAAHSDSAIMKYVMWCPAMNPSTSLYNRGEEIVLQIIPVYCFRTHKIPYRVFIRNYRSYITFSIPRTTAQEWLDKTAEIMDSMLAHQKQFDEKMLSELGIESLPVRIFDE